MQDFQFELTFHDKESFQEIQNAIDEMKKVLIPILEQIAELTQKIQDSKDIQKSVIIASEICHEFENLVTPVSDISNMIVETIPNLRNISYECTLISNQFYNSIDQLMQTLNFPVIQPEITKKQLENRIKLMDKNTLQETIFKISKIVKFAPIKKSTKSAILKFLSQLGTDVLSGIISGVLAEIILYLIKIWLFN